MNNLIDEKIKEYKKLIEVNSTEIDRLMYENNLIRQFIRELNDIKKKERK